MKFCCCLALVLMSALMAFPADVNGVWKGSVETPMGPMENTITLQADGEKLNGLVKTDIFESKIENGLLNGDKVSFVVNTEFGTLNYEGRLSGDELQLNVSVADGNPAELKARKQKQASPRHKGW
jgi:hypothetical protein